MHKIEIREDCKVCGGQIVDNRFRTYCSTKCRIKNNNQTRKEYQKKWLYEMRKRQKTLQEEQKNVVVENNTDNGLTQTQTGV